MALRHLDLFSGIGGFALGLSRAGLSLPVGFVEIDPFCQAVLRRHWPHVPIHGDISTREFHEGEADVVTGGFPCQDISFAGRGAGLAGKRSGLWWELLRAICVVRPRFAIVENVAALLHRGMDEVLGGLAAVGYDSEWHCIPARAVGAPHRRDRIWIVAHPRGEQQQGGRAPLGGALAEELARAAADADGAAWGPEAGGAIAECRACENGVGQGQSRRCRDRSPGAGGHWAAEPGIRRVAHGIPHRAHRLRALGNAIVPQVAEVIGRAALTHMRHDKESAA